MGYACPVCAAPQADGEHLANHLAFSALLGHEDHEAWLDEHAPGWGDDDPATLAETVTPAAETVEYHEVFEDTTGEGPELVDDPVGGPGTPPAPGPEGLDAEARRVVAEARRLTAERHGDGDDGQHDPGSGDERAAPDREGDEDSDDAVPQGDDADATAGDENGK